MKNLKFKKIIIRWLLIFIIWVSGIVVMAQSIPTATTEAATGITATDAVLNGIVNANENETSVWFEYGLNTQYSHTVFADPRIVSGADNTAVSAVLGELSANTTYHYRVVATSSGGTTYGEDMTFTTLPNPPVVVTSAATGIEATTATLNGTVNALGNDATVTFEYGTTTAYGNTVTADESPVSGSVVTPVSKEITGLTNGVTYHYRVVAVNLGGTSYGLDMTFVAGSLAPTATTIAATNIGATSAALNGTVNANNSNTTVTFEYGTTTSYGRTSTAVQSPVSGSIDTAVNVSITELTPGATYHYRVVAQNANGTTYGNDLTFSTLLIPSAITMAASSVTTSGATLNGIVNARGLTTTVTFQYGTTTSYGTSVTADQNPVTGSINTAVSRTISGLAINTLYHYRVVAQNNDGTSYGSDMTFSTSSNPPSVTTTAASLVLTNQATLNGSVNAHGNLTTLFFEYGPDTNYDRVASAVPSPVSGSTDTAISASLTGLTNGTLYHYRLVGVYANGTIYGDDMTFTTTTSPAVQTDAATAIGITTATLNCTANANNLNPVSIIFEYGTTTAYGNSVNATPSTLNGGTNNTAAAAALSSLTPNTTYHFRAVVQFGATVVYGSDRTFTTRLPITVTTLAATGVGETSATLNGTINAGNTTMTIVFQYGLDTSYGTGVSAIPGQVTGSTDTPVNQTINGLNANTTYHYRVVGTNAEDGAYYGGDMTFTTAPLPPSVVTNTPSNITTTGATLNGTVNANNNTTTVTFEYGQTMAYGQTVSAVPGSVNGSTGTAVSATLSSLAPDTIYHFRVVGQNAVGTANGGDLAFRTRGAEIPVVTTSPVTNITSSSATTGGNVTDEGGRPVTARGVCWNTTPNPTIANHTTHDGPGSGTFTSQVTGLNENTTYYVRAYATSVYGTAYGGQIQFTTNSQLVQTRITEPDEGETVSGTITIAVNATVANAQSSALEHLRANAIARVEFYIDENLLSQDTSSPYEIQWDSTTVENGSHMIKAMAYDQANKSSQDDITVTVFNENGEKPGELQVNREALFFAAIQDGGATTGVQTILIDNIGEGTLNWRINFVSGWLSCTPGSGQDASAVGVTVDGLGLPVGVYQDTITITNSDNDDDVITIPVSFTIYEPGATVSPVGVFERPGDNSTVHGSIPVTGWVVDDIEVEKVMLYRDAVAGEGNGLVFIDNAIFVDGARPDVEAVCPSMPFNYQAGWGYMLLAQTLPGQGNGTFSLTAIAVDKEGNQVTLGRKTIVCDSASFVEPFGTIDTPAQGGVASGSSYVHFGWALTPPPNTIPFDGSTIIVWVDGVPLGHPVYNQFRQDIANVFPGYNNSNGAIGYFLLDTTQYTNGLHTIAWSVTDDAGNSSGMGSRFFNIFNYGHPHFNVPALYNPVVEDEILSPTLTVKELDHVEFQVSNQFTGIQGYRLVNNKARPLPAGSTLHKGNGRFYWNPASGFKGTYTLVFKIKKQDGKIQRKSIDITVEEK